MARVRHWVHVRLAGFRVSPRTPLLRLLSSCIAPCRAYPTHSCCIGCRFCRPRVFVCPLSLLILRKLCVWGICSASHTSLHLTLPSARARPRSRTVVAHSTGGPSPNPMFTLSHPRPMSTRPGDDVIDADLSRRALQLLSALDLRISSTVRIHLERCVWSCNWSPLVPRLFASSARYSCWVFESLCCYSRPR